MNYNVILIDEARQDFNKLDNSKKIQAAKQLKKLERAMQLAMFVIKLRQVELDCLFCD